MTKAGFTIRAPGNRPWLLLLVIGTGYLALTVLNLTSVRAGQAVGYVALGCCYVPLVWAIRSVGVDLTSQSVIVRGFRRRTVPWQDVHAVVSQVSSTGTSAARLILGNGKSVTLPYPRTLWGEGDAQYEREFRRIEQWWRTWAPASVERRGSVERRRSVERPGSVERRRSVEKRVALDDLLAAGANPDR